MNRVIVVVAILALLAFFGFALTRPTEETKILKVDLPALKAMEYFSDTSSINKWMMPFAAHATPFRNDRMINGTDTLTLLKLSALQMDFRRSDPKQHFDYSLSVAADKDSAHTSYIILSYNSTRWNSLFGENKFAQDAEASMDSLGTYLDNPSKLYGFDIKGTLVTDTSFLFASKKIRRADFVAESKALYNMLIDEAKKRDAGYNGVRIFHYTDEGDSSRMIYAGVGVTKRIDTKEGDKVSYKMMPYQRNLLVIDYNGKYVDVPKAYTALEKYRIDNRYVTMAIPFHKYLDSGYGFSDSQQVRLKVCYPVF